MNILHINEQRTWGGGEQQASWLIQGLVRRGHSVTLAGRPDGAFLANDHGGVTLRRVALPFRGEWDVFSARALGCVVRGQEIGLLHAHTSHAHMLACMGRFFARTGRVLVHRRVSFAPKNNAVNRWKYSLPDHFVCVSERVARGLREYGIPPERMTVVHSAVDASRLDVPPVSRQELGVPKDAPLLVNTGALAGAKDHANLLEAMAKVRAVLPEARLVIAGEGPLRKELERRVTDLGLEDAVTLPGHRKDAPAIIKAADVYVSSSWSEGLGTAILEALTAKIPVVAADAGGPAEVIRPGETGWLVPCRNATRLAEAIIECLQDRERAAAMAEAGRRLVDEKFTAERMVESNIAVYERLLPQMAAL